MGVEQGRGEQFDPVETAVSELQDPIDLTQIDKIRRLPDPRFKNSDFPERKGRIRSSAELAAEIK